ncbi:MAG TPA: SET domain-containing protein-lysine N-methyltransferase [Pyrinomonadaceae bacterium]|nr:SET domain-containing protein-lysine N-methyltransferase [Pyrinomonadaceae bacterium]
MKTAAVKTAEAKAKVKVPKAEAEVPRGVKELAYGIEIKPSSIDGKGCFAAVPFRARHKVAELTGERISRVEAARRMRGKRRLHICAIDAYWNVDSSRGGNGTMFINHCCAPNCFMRVTAGRIIIYALRDIEAGEELTLDYGETYHDDSKLCRCGAPTCRVTMNPPRERRR